MKAKKTVLILAFIVIGLAVVGAFAFRSHLHTSRQISLSTPSGEVKNFNSGSTLSQVRPVPPSPWPVNDASPTSFVRNVIAVEPLLDDLRAAYAANNLPVRIRIQDQLSKAWEANPPTTTALLNQIRDNQSPSEYRIYFAKALANRIKMQMYGESEIATAVAELRSIIGSASDPPAFRVDLANILTSVDQSGRAVQAIAPLLSESDDETAVKAVAALCRSTNELAVECVLAFAKTDDLLKTKPLALLSALGPLSTTTNDVSPLLTQIVGTTDDFRIYAGAVQCLISARSSSGVLDAIAESVNAASRFPNQHAQSIRLCAAAARKHERFFQEHKTGLDTGTLDTFDELLKTEVGR